MNRRNWITNILGGSAALAALAGTHLLGAEHKHEHEKHKKEHEKKEHEGHKHHLKKYDNSHFYKADGSFNEEAAKEAYVEMFKHFHYSLADVVNDKRFWILDFGLGDFANVGMAGIFWLNDKDHGYFGHEIYLLPGQMIPEHCHVEAEGKPAKHEYWQVRHGSIYNFGEGGSNDDKQPVQIPKSQLDANAITAFKCVELKTGCGESSEAGLNRLGAYHFMMGGPEGVIVTEYASFHSGDGLKLQNKKAFMGNTAAKKS